MHRGFSDAACAHVQVLYAFAKVCKRNNAMLHGGKGVILNKTCTLFTSNEI